VIEKGRRGVDRREKKTVGEKRGERKERMRWEVGD